MNTPNLSMNPTIPSAMSQESLEEKKTHIPPLAPNTYPMVPGIVRGMPISSPSNTSSSASLYVGELDKDVTESHLFELFSQVGPVASIRVCRDAVTRRSLGYAYVNFHNAEDGERALDALNYTVIKGQACRIMWSQRDPSLRRSGTGNVFIKNLDKNIDNKILHDTFSAFGNILSCKVVADENGSKGYGFVHFESQDAADLSIEKVNGMCLNDKKVYVCHHVHRRERVSKLEEMKERYTNIYVKNLAETVTDEELESLFSSFGEITSAIVQKDDSGKSKGFGFVNFKSHESAQAAVSEMNDKDVHQNKITVCRAQSKSEREEDLRRQYETARMERMSKYYGINLYIKNIDESIDDEKLQSEFSPFGEISSFKIMRDEKGISKGFGFVCYSTPEEANKALAEMNGKMLASKPIYVALAQRKEDRRSALEAQHVQRSQFRMMPGMPMYYPGSGMFMGGRSMPSYPPNTMMYPNVRGARYPPYPFRPNSYSNSIQPSSVPQADGANIGNAPPSSNTGSLSQSIPSMSMLPNQNASMMMNQNMRGNQRQYRPRGAFNNGSSSHSNAYSVSNGTSVSRNIPYNGMNQSSQMQSYPRRGAYGHYSGFRGNGMVNRGGARGSQPDYFNQHPYYSTFSDPSFSQPYHDVSSTSAFAQALASATPELQKTLLGERLFPLVEAREAALASKITGMLLDMDNGELLHLLESPDSLSAKVAEALSLLHVSTTPSLMVDLSVNSSS